jgi:hypothetical protein
MSRHPLRQGTWIRSNVAIGDSGDFSEREAPPGAVGYVEYVEDHRSDGTPGFSYSIHFIPSGISNRFDDNEIDTQADILDVDDPAIPHKTERDLYEAVANLYYRTTSSRGGVLRGLRCRHGQEPHPGRPLPLRILAT